MSFLSKNALIGAAEIGCRIPLIFTMGLIARSVGTDIFGNWALILLFQTLVASVASMGLTTAIARFSAKATDRDAGQYLLLAFAVGIPILLAATVASLVFQSQLGDLLGLNHNLRWLLPLSVALSAGSMADGFLNAWFKARLLVSRQIAFVGLRTLCEVAATVAVFWFMLSPPGIGSMLAVYIVIITASRLILYPLLFVRSGTGLSLPSSDERIAALRYGLPMMPAMLLMWFIGQCDRLFLSHIVDKHSLGIYAVGATFAAYTVFLGYAVYPLLLPQAVRLHDDGKSIEALFWDSQRLFFCLWAVAACMLSIWAGDIIHFTAGPAYADAALILIVLSLASGVDQLFGMSEYGLYLTKRTGLVLALHACYAALIATSVTLDAIELGIWAVPYGILASSVLFNIARYIIAARYVALPPIVRPLAMTAALLAAVGVLATLAPTMSFAAHAAASVIVVGIIGAVVSLKAAMQGDLIELMSRYHIR